MTQHNTENNTKNTDHSYATTYRVVYGGINDDGEVIPATRSHRVIITAISDEYAIKGALYQGEELTQQFLPLPEGNVHVTLEKIVKAPQQQRRRGITLSLPEQQTFTGEGREHLGVEERNLRGSAPDNPYLRDIMNQQRRYARPLALQSIEDVELENV